MKDQPNRSHNEPGAPRLGHHRPYDIFITHAWRYHEDWTKLCDLLDHSPALKWRNFSLPWHDPAMDPNSKVGGEFIWNFLESQIIPVHVVIFLAGVYTIKSAHRWLDLEVEFARRHKKPVIGMPGLTETVVPESVSSFCDVNATWESQSIVAALERACRASEQNQMVSDG